MSVFCTFSRYLCLGEIVATLLMGATAHAHTLELSTARVTLREGHVDIAVELDLVQWLIALGPESRDATTIATASDEVLAEWTADARKSMQDQGRVDVDGRQAQLVLRAFPNPQAIRLLAAQASASPHAHGAMSTLHLESVKPIGAARSIAVSLPDTLGRVLYTFVQPETRLAQPGTQTSFQVLSPPAKDVAVAPALSGGRTWVAIAAGALAAIALLAQFLPRRRTTPAELSQKKEGAS